MEHQKESGKLSINLIANMVAFVVHAGIQFFVVPTLNQQVGNEAYGFISIANEFVQYANIFTVLLNGVVGRFVAFEVHRGEIKKANQYFNSVLVADMIISFVFTVVGIVFVSRVERILVISPELVTDVKVIFGLTFFNFILVTLFSVLNVATFVKNRIDVAAVRNIIGYLVELLVIAGLFLLMPTVKPYFLVAGTLAGTIFLTIANIGITWKLTPELKISLRDYRFGMMKNMLKTGIWSSISQLASVLLGSTTLIMGNLFLGGNVVGLISLSKTIPNCLNTLFYAIYNVFTPNMVKSYAQGDIEGMVEQGKKSMKIMSFILIPAVAGVLVFIPDFFKLWVPGKSVEELVSITRYCRIVALGMMVEMPSLPLMYFAVATNKVRKDTLFTLSCSGVLLGLTYLGLRSFSMGGEVIVWSQTMNMLITFAFWTPGYAARTVERKWTTFYPCYLRCIMSAAVMIFLYSVMKLFVTMSTWLGFLLIAGCAGACGYLVAFAVLFSGEEKKTVLDKIQKVIRRNA